MLSALFRAIIIILLLFLAYSYFRGGKTDLKAKIIQAVPRNYLQNASPKVLDYVIGQMPPDKKVELASLSAQLASASTNFDPWSQQKIKELKIAIVDEIYKSILTQIKK